MPAHQVRPPAHTSAGESMLTAMSRASKLPQFGSPSGNGSICEMYWLNTDSKKRIHGELWADYWHRSGSEVRENFQHLMSVTDFSKEAWSWGLQDDHTRPRFRCLFRHGI